MVTAWRENPPTHLRHRWRGPQRRIGLTDGIATGKSTVAAILSDNHGLPVLDADIYVHKLLAHGATQAMLECYGPQVQTPDGGLDRRSLGRIIFARPAERRWLEVLTHPLVEDIITRRQRWCWWGAPPGKRPPQPPGSPAADSVPVAAGAQAQPG